MKICQVNDLLRLLIHVLKLYFLHILTFKNTSPFPKIGHFLLYLRKKYLAFKMPVLSAQISTRYTQSEAENAS